MALLQAAEINETVITVRTGICREKALHSNAYLRTDNFMGSNSWLNIFKRSNIVYRTLVLEVVSLIQMYMMEK
jgi:hypothetical protein